jgi:hypothetical protein
MCRCNVVLFVSVLSFTATTLFAETHFVKPGGNRPLQHAFSKAKAGDEVRVAAGLYEESIDLPAGVALKGGFHPDDFEKHEELSDTALKSADHDAKSYAGKTVLRGTGAHYTVMARGLETGASMQDLVVIGPDVHAETGASSFALVVMDGKGVGLQRVKLIGGVGGSGRAGDPGKGTSHACEYEGAWASGGSGRSGSDGPDWETIKSRWIPGCWPGELLCQANPGAKGEDVKDGNGAIVALGGTGGKAGSGECRCSKFSESNGGDGGDGGKGDDGRSGAPGQARGDNREGWFAVAEHELVWTADPGGVGGAGFAGAGGGGGGSGGSRFVEWLTCPHGRLMGAQGGSGGRGGCGGLGGQGGGSGGGSFALVVKSTEIVADNVSILIGQGGAAGIGGDGAKGSQGAPHDKGSIDVATSTCSGDTRKAGPGGPGGDGGNGGAGGGGAGGNGGIAAGIARVGDEAVFGGTYVVRGGKGGEGGKGGVSQGDSNHPHGEKGNSGAVYTDHPFRLMTKLSLTNVLNAQ